MHQIGAVPFERNYAWRTSSRSMMVEASARIDQQEIDPLPSFATKVA